VNVTASKLHATWSRPSSLLIRHLAYSWLCIGLVVTPSAQAADWLDRLFSKKQTSAARLAQDLQETRTIALLSFTGSTGITATEAIGKQLGKEGSLQLLPEKSARFLLSGNSTGGRITGILKGRNGKIIFDSRYGAPEIDDNIAALIDDIMLAVTGMPSLASSRIAFVAKVSGVKQVHVCGPDGSGLTQITDSPFGAVSPAMAPDGSLVGYTSYASGFPSVVLVDLRVGMERLLANAPGTNSGIAFAPEDRQAALAMSFLGNPEIFVIDLATNNAVCISESKGVPNSPAWHPDGKRLIYASDEGNGSQLFVADVSSDSPPRPWASGTSFASDPEWSPDGDVIAFTARVAGDWAVVLKPFDGGSCKVLRRGGAQHPTWSPDGKSVAYVQNGQLWVHHLSTDKRHSIVRGRGDISEPRWMR